MSSNTVTRTLAPAALKAEQGRRVNNKQRAKAAREAAVAAGATPEEVAEAVRKAKAKAKGFVLPSLLDTEIEALLNGEVVTKEFRSGRVETIAVKAD